MRSRRRPPHDRAAEAIADDADLAAFLGDFDRGGCVAQRLLDIDLADDGHAARPRIRIVADIKTLLDVIEHRRRDREIAFGGEPVGDRPDMGVDTKNLLNDDDPAAGLSRRVRAPRLDRGRALRLQFNPMSHVDLQGLVKD